ncbi:hypothetical protein [Chryseobacterium cheonjiense]|uniref:Uncharacterized protein n=1 Tax=Chryseobacterium cheonjiense TaxID=2728845 RepID=A0A7Y0A534_9FLAO|nr:hypothetical protein [Chryseobacterium cheonjiense]NML56731.1 hypothetical protein [Chryseobacterium cheonjiense]
MEEEIMRETGESPLIRQVRFNPAIPETYRNSNQQPLITPEVIEERITDIEEVVVTGARASRGFIERAIDWIGEQFTGDSNTLQVRQNAQKGANFEQVPKQDLKNSGETNIQEQVTIKPNQP